MTASRVYLRYLRPLKKYTLIRLRRQPQRDALQTIVHAGDISHLIRQNDTITHTQKKTYIFQFIAINTLTVNFFLF